MNKKRIIFLNLLIILLLFFKVSYASSAKVEILIDTSSIPSEKKVNLELKLSNLEDIDVSKPIAVSGYIDYDKTLFSDIEMEKSINGWNGQLSKVTYKFVADGSSMPKDGIIAKFTLTVSNDIKVIDKSTIKLNSITIAAFTETGEGIKLDNLNLTAFISMNNEESNSNINDGSNSDTGQANKNEVNSDIINANNQTNNDTIGNSNSDESDEESNKQNNDQSVNQNEVFNESLNFVEDLTITKDEKLPQTGVKYTFIIFIFIFLIVSIIIFIKYKKFYD